MMTTKRREFLEGVVTTEKAEMPHICHRCKTEIKKYDIYYNLKYNQSGKEYQICKKCWKVKSNKEK